jgi:Fe-S-cluster containining protein
MRSMLRFHLAYRCRDSGACCSSGWPIPVEATLYRTLDEAIAAGRLSVPGRAAFVEAALPADYARLLAMDAHGACVFHDAASKRCVIHQALGPTAKPRSCRAFPRIVVQDPRGVSISLSHYCPSAVDLLFGSSSLESPSSASDAVEIVDVLPEADDLDALEGLDARDALPPVLREGVLLDWESLTRWERHAADVFNRASSPEAALARLWRSSDLVRSWRAEDGPLATHVDRVARVVDAEGSSGSSFDGFCADTPRGFFSDTSLVSAVLMAIPEDLRPPPRPSLVEAPDASPGDARHEAGRVLCRYLAARAHACWPLHQGAHGLRSQLVYLEAALAVIRRHLSATHDLREALRRADLWLVHLASPDRLASALDALLSPR